jgi:hypothetical protein
MKIWVDLGHEKVKLNAWFAGCDRHHVDNDQIIHLPRELHETIRHRQLDTGNMAKMNAIAYNFLFKQEVEVAAA